MKTATSHGRDIVPLASMAAHERAPFARSLARDQDTFALILEKKIETFTVFDFFRILTCDPDAKFSVNYHGEFTNILESIIEDFRNDYKVTRIQVSSLNTHECRRYFVERIGSKPRPKHEKGQPLMMWEKPSGIGTQWR